MTGAEIQDAIHDLDDLLEDERDALLSGDLEKIGRLLDRKEALIEALSAMENVQANALRDLTDKLKRNQDLMDYALDGIRTVAQRLSTLRRVRRKLDTYDSQGAKRTIDVAAENSVEKRA